MQRTQSIAADIGAFDKKKLFRGIQNRIDAAAILSSNIKKQNQGSKRGQVPALKPGEMSLFHAAMARQSVFRAKHRNPKTELLWYVLNTSCSHESIKLQNTYIYNIASQEEQATIIPLAIGRLFSPPGLPSPNFLDHAAEDYSLAAQSWILSKPGDDRYSETRIAVVESIVSLRDVLKLPEISRLSEVSVFFERLGYKGSIESFET